MQLPKNDALSGLCNGMIEAWNIQNKKDAAILFVIEDVTYNICDQVRIQLNSFVKSEMIYYIFNVFAEIPWILHSSNATRD